VLGANSPPSPRYMGAPIKAVRPHSRPGVARKRVLTCNVPSMISGWNWLGPARDALEGVGRRPRTTLGLVPERAFTTGPVRRSA
jgi:hypothetical protein